MFHAVLAIRDKTHQCQDKTMAEYETFAKAPIEEAVLDIQVDVPSGTDLDLLLNSLHGAHQNISGSFPDVKPRYSLQFNFGDLTDVNNISANQTGGMDGWIYKSPDAKIAQFRLDGYSFSKLRPYTDWESVKKEARDIWQLYVQAIGPTRVTRVTRVATRYINKIYLPLPFTDFNEYLNTRPEIAEGIDQGIGDLLMRLVIPQKNTSIISILTERFDPPTMGVNEARFLPFILDIDVFQPVDFAPESESIWETLDALRDVKNSVFFKSITEKTKELFR